jgi:hypothetical protein
MDYYLIDSNKSGYTIFCKRILLSSSLLLSVSLMTEDLNVKKHILLYLVILERATYK